MRSNLSLVPVPTPVLHGLARGVVSTESDHLLSPYLRGDECSGLWRMRSEQIAATPADAPWITRFVVVHGCLTPVGLAGFHGSPDESGMVEIGYRIDPQYRGRGYARQALETLIAVAKARPAVRTVRATISPDNHVSLAFVRGHGFTEVGEQWDVDDGVETILERPAS